MLHAINEIDSSISTNDTLKATQYFLNYAASNPNGEIIFRASDMILQVGSYAVYLVFHDTRSRAGGYHYLGNKDRNLFNGPILVLAKVNKNVMASAAVAKIIGLFMNGQEAFPLRQCLQELGYPQPDTPMKTDNSTANGIINGIMKQK